ncbi:MAG: hypothetical protein ACTSXD_03625 [Candidatus Heimdallarchaeaceae archaeon]
MTKKQKKNIKKLKYGSGEYCALEDLTGAEIIKTLLKMSKEADAPLLIEAQYYSDILTTIIVVKAINKQKKKWLETGFYAEDKHFKDEFWAL